MKIEDAQLLNHSLSESSEMLRTNFYSIKGTPHWLGEAAFIKLLINLKDCLQLLNKYGCRLTFSDDLPAGGDITKQVLDMRNAACHIGSASRLLSKGTSSLHYGVKTGKGTLLSMGALKMENPYADDIAFFYGELRLLLKRHIHRAVREAVPVSENLVKGKGLHWWPVA